MTRRDHRRIGREIGAYLDGELDGERARTIAGHLEECWVCNDTAHDLRLIRASLTNLRRAAPRDLAAIRLHRLAARLSG